MKLKELLEVCKKSIILLSVPGRECLLNNWSGDLTPWGDYKVTSIETFYNRTSLFKYGLLVRVKPTDE